MKPYNPSQTLEIERLLKRNEFANLVTYLHSFYEERNKHTLKEAFSTWKEHFGEDLNPQQSKWMHTVMGTAHLLYLDLDESMRHFVAANNTLGLKHVLHLGRLYGRFSAVDNINSLGILNNNPVLQLEKETYESFLKDSVIPHISIRQDEQSYLLNEAVFERVMQHLKFDAYAQKKLARKTVRAMQDAGNLDLPRQYLLAQKSNDAYLIDKTKKAFDERQGKRKTIDAVAQKIIDGNNLKLIEKIQEGDDNDFYPLSAHIYLVTSGEQKFVLKEHIPYRVDFSCLNGYNQELELYATRLDFPAIPKLVDAFNEENSLFMLLERREGTVLSSHTQKGNLLPLDAALTVVQEAALFLDFLHSPGIVYGDMKDKNILYNGSVSFVDFGMASTRMHIENETGEEFVNQVLSNAEYACPETILMSRVYKKSDIFQLGILLHKLITGRHPFASGKATQNYTEREAELTAFSLANLWNKPGLHYTTLRQHPGIQSILASMLEKDYTLRPNAEEVFDSIENLKVMQ